MLERLDLLSLLVPVPTSMLLLKVRLTMAAIITTSPNLQGLVVRCDTHVVQHGRQQASVFMFGGGQQGRRTAGEVAVRQPLQSHATTALCEWPWGRLRGCSLAHAHTAHVNTCAPAHLKKCTASTLTVTQGPWASVLAARPAAMSIQDSTCPRAHRHTHNISAACLRQGAGGAVLHCRHTCPPKHMPRASTSAGATIWCMTMRVAPIGTVSGSVSGTSAEGAGERTMLLLVLPCAASSLLSCSSRTLTRSRSSYTSAWPGWGCIFGNLICC